MPVRLKIQPTAKVVTEPSVLDRLGGLKGLLAGGTRALTGAASAEGLLPGALISGAGELGAEAIEGSLFDQSLGRSAARIGTAGAIGAVPFGAVLKEGRPIASALRGAAYSGIGEGAREAAAGHDVDPEAVATSAATGGALTGGLSYLMKLFGGKALPPASAPLGPKTAQETAQELVARRGAKFDKKAAGRLQDSYETQLSNKVANEEGKANTLDELFQTNSAKRDAGITKEANIASRRYEDEATKAAADAALAKSIEEERAAAGVKAQPPAFSKSKSAPAPEGGRQSMSTRFKYPDEDDMDQANGGPFRDSFSELDAPSEGRPKEIYDAWRAKGVTHEKAVDLAAKGIMPRAGAGKTRIGTVPDPSKFSDAGKVQLAAEGDIPSAEAIRSAAGEPPVTGLSEGVEPVGTGPTGGTVGPTTAPEQTLEGLLGGKPGAASPVPEGGAQPLSVFRNPTEAANTHFDALKGLLRRKKGPAVTDFPANEIPEEGRGVAWKAASRLNKEAAAGAAPTTTPTATYLGEQPGLGPLYNIEGGPSHGSTVSAAKLNELGIEVPPSAGPPDAGAINPESPERLSAMERLRKLLTEQKGGDTGGTITNLKSEKGAIDPMLLARLGLGAGGALLGAATDPLGNRVASAVAGGAIGALAPSAIKTLSEVGANKDVIDNLNPASLKTPEGILHAASSIFKTLPQIQRFNYLANEWGLPANAIFGPYGSAVMGALEHGLSDDERGWVLLKSLHPLAFLKEFKNSFQEAGERITQGELGRAENAQIGPNASFGQRLLTAPGHYMTTGDVAARRFMERAGFTEAEAARMTLTSEAETRLGKDTVRWGRKNPIGGLLNPFPRTTTNIAEQGFQRMPIIGSIMQGKREVPDSMKMQLIQQGILSPAVMGTSFFIGDNLDPETAKIVRRFVSNFGGQYAMQAALGFAAGQAAHEGQPIVSTKTLSPAINALPLPSTQPITEWGKFVLDDKHPIPSGAMPSRLKTLFFPSDTPSSSTVPNIKRLPRIRRR